MKTAISPSRAETDVKKFTVIVKPTHACNLRCIYCYVPRGAERGLMSSTTLHNVMMQVADVGQGKQITFIWHGGEPLLVGLPFFREVASISHVLRNNGHHIKNVIQTNGTLVTNDLVDFIAEERDFRLGLSLDGPAHINDVSRPKARGHGSFGEIMSTVKKIRERDEREGTDCVGGGVICVIGKHNIKQLEEIYSFFKAHQISVKINPLFVSGRATDELSVTPDEYADAMCRLFDVWVNGNDDSIRVDPFESIISSLISGDPRSCISSRACTKTFVSIGPLGDVYPCGRFDGIKKFHLGNVNTPDGLRNSLMSSMYLQLDSRPEKLGNTCIECPYLVICNGGCMHNAYLQGNVMAKDPFCGFYKKLYGHILSKVHEVLGQAENVTLNQGVTP